MNMDTEVFEACVRDGVHQEVILRDLADGQESGISGTPGFWVLGPGGQTEVIRGAYPYETFKEVFDAMLN
jgi:predicted DsbA family dithiol-disulfide isomerase